MPGDKSVVEEKLSWASTPAVRKSMIGNKSRDTKPELIVRRLLHASGLRYRVHARPIKDWNRRADNVFSRVKIVVFVNGCFWHGCPKHFVAPKANAEYWIPKIARNIERGNETTLRLRHEGWLVIKILEHEDLEEATNETLVRVQKRLFRV